MSYLVVYTGYGAILAVSPEGSPEPSLFAGKSIFAWADSFNNLQINYQYEKKKKKKRIAGNV